MTILITGGAGYIGSHTVVELLKLGEKIVIVDDFSNSSPLVLDRIKTILQQENIANPQISFYEGDFGDAKLLDKIFSEHKIDSVIHFAGFKAVGESVKLPLNYYYNNVAKTLVLLEKMQQYQVYNLVFSSSATVYGDPTRVPIKESDPTQEPTSPYGASKLMVERIMQDVFKASPKFSMIILRYFNPIGAHKSGLIGEDPSGIPNNLCPYITQVAVGKLKSLSIYGNDYNTIDGTGVRDYIHVVDLAIGHAKALATHQNDKGVHIYNLGTGTGISVLEMVHAFEHELGREISHQFAPRRAGDIATCFADPTKALEKIGFKTQFGLKQMVKDSWNWQKNNPNGYK